MVSVGIANILVDGKDVRRFVLLRLSISVFVFSWPFYTLGTFGISWASSGFGLQTTLLGQLAVTTSFDSPNIVLAAEMPLRCATA